MLFVTDYTFASWNRVPDQVVHINVKYDQQARMFYDLTANGLDFTEISIIDDNQIKIRHSRDGYKGVRVPPSSSFRFVRDTYFELKNYDLVGVSKRDILPINIGRGNSKIIGMPTTSASRYYYSNGCTQSDNWTEGFVSFDAWVTKNSAFYSPDACLGMFGVTTQYADYVFPNDGAAIGYVERYFELDLRTINKLPLDTYFGIYDSLPTADVIRIGNTDLGREMYRYMISIELKPSINSFRIDNENLSFSVNKQSSTINGKAQTGFTVIGSFLNSQAFDMTFNSTNSSLCGGEFCLLNTSLGTTIPYTTKVFDPSTLQEKPVSKNGQKVTVYADQNYHLSGGLFFEFDTKNTNLSGTFNDLLTVMIELKLI